MKMLFQSGVWGRFWVELDHGSCSPEMIHEEASVPHDLVWGLSLNFLPHSEESWYSKISTSYAPEMVNTIIPLYPDIPAGYQNPSPLHKMV
jgi:hypothetical protein